MAILRKTALVNRTRLTEIGRIYKGHPKPDRGPGKDYASSYLRFEPADRFKLQQASSPDHPNLFAELKARWEMLIQTGSIVIRFPYSSIGANWNWQNKVIKKVGAGTKTFVECDGETCSRWTEDGKTKDGKTIPVFKRGSKPCAAQDGKECPLGCKAKGMLSFMVPDLHPGGIVVFPINSPVDVSAIDGYLNAYQSFDLSAVPFHLFRRADQITWEENGETKSKINWGLHLEVDPTISQLMLKSREAAYRHQLEAEIIGEIEPAAPLQLQPAKVAEIFQQSDRFINFQKQLQQAANAGNQAKIVELADIAKRIIREEGYDLSGLAAIDREVSIALEIAAANQE